MAQVAGALIGITFLAVTFFLSGIYDRFSRFALPLYETNLSDRGGSKKRSDPGGVNDEELFDGDPLVVFAAFSVAVTWILFLIPLVLSLTAISRELNHTWLFAAEIAALLGPLEWSLHVRNQQLSRLASYRTQEERIWPLLEWAFDVLLTAFVSFLAFGVWCDLPKTDEKFFGATLKIFCLVSIAVGTYVLNKDLFFFFKGQA